MRKAKDLSFLTVPLFDLQTSIWESIKIQNIKNRLIIFLLYDIQFIITWHANSTN